MSIINETHDHVRQYTVARVHPWTGPGEYGFDLMGPGFRRGFYEVTLKGDGTVTETGDDISASHKGQAVFERLVDGVLEVALEADPVIRRHVEALGTATVRALIGEQVPRLRDEIVTSLRRAVAS